MLTRGIELQVKAEENHGEGEILTDGRFDAMLETTFCAFYMAEGG